MIENKEWFKDWFNSPFYLKVYSHRNYDDANLFFDLIEKTIPIKKNYLILDLCCGNGRLSSLIAKRGYNVSGKDLSENLIDLAKKEADQLGLKIDYEICDIRKFDEREIYDIVISFFTSFGYLTNSENEIVFNKMAGSVKKGGYLIFDFFNAENIKKSLVEKDEKKIEEMVVYQNRKISDGRLIKEITICSTNGNEKYIESVQIYAKNEIENLFKNNGFEIISCFGDYKGSEQNDESPRVILFGKKIK